MSSRALATGLALLLVCTAAQANQSPQQPPAKPAAPSPVVVQVQEPQRTPEELAQEHQDREARRANDQATLEINRKLVRIGWWQVVVFALQLLVFGFQAIMLRQTVTAASNQSKDMQDSIAESARAATALETLGHNVANSAQIAAESVATVKERTAIQMRAYLTVLIGTAAYQEREKNIRFEARSLLVNGGNTPARNVRFACRAAILPAPLAPDTVLPEVGPFPGGAMLGQHQNSVMIAVVPDYVPDQEVAAIKAATTQALYIWGKVLYDDVFAEEHTTDFCQALFWFPDGTVNGFHIAGRNQAT